jgi:hypothetical protein
MCLHVFFTISYSWLNISLHLGVFTFFQLETREDHQRLNLHPLSIDFEVYVGIEHSNDQD